MTIEEKRDQVEAILYQMDEDSIVEAWNTLCENNGKEESIIHSMDDVDEMFEGYSVREAHDEFDLSDFRWSDYWYVEGRCSTPVSYFNAEDAIDYEELLDYALENNEDFNEYAIREVLDEPEDKEETEEEKKVEEVEEEEELKYISVFNTDIDLLRTALLAMKQRCDSSDSSSPTHKYVEHIIYLLWKLQIAGEE